MKMISKTRKMSVSGVMLISAKMPSSPSSLEALGPPIAMLHRRRRLQFGRGSLVAGGRGGVRLLLAQELDELLGHQLQLERRLAQPRHEIVVDDHRLDG